ncbi:hypothetical protein BEWA_030460 [Theileria equi strain WA]|uniref:Uncharacterized protein n=1 Tax=Theileria equi strain WA TaxID=1537102 RepID=L0AY52_THEEQ|nr:hypothetical protein BEWA_030460 [Theileria equi strain WA]AFZ80193.1 hypothetical protein BEWA_030460 [Theileria equi strain WA]|eukprot:XP_004829859.1 hypothetical protein BEWA_030460 [Theileria equi strain WA]
MGGSHSKPVTIDINNRPGSTGDQVQKDGKGGYFYRTDDGGKVLLTDEWYPDLEGTYRKFTHRPRDGKISKINKGGESQTGLGTLTTYDSVSVYYWSGDNSFSNPLLIQLCEGDKYYTTTGNNTWSKQNSITFDKLKQGLDKENCLKNKAHIVKIAEKPSSSTTYQCFSCRASIQVYPGSDSSGDTTYYGHTITSVSGFKNGGKWQVGFPSIRGVGVIFVYWDTSEQKPVLIRYQTGNPRYFRKSAENGTSWIEVSNAPPAPNQASSLQTPTLPLDLSNTDGKYNYQGTTNIIMAVLLSHISDGYSKFEHSFRGTPFKVTEIKHGQTTQLSGISSSNPLLSVSAYYLGDSPNLSKLLLVELRSSGRGTTYKYFYRVQKDGNNWTEFKGPGGKTGQQLVGSSLKRALDELKKTQFPEASKDATTIIVGSSVGSGIGGTGLGGLAVWVWYKYFFDPVVRLV